jgi:hypothetical protein
MYIYKYTLGNEILSKNPLLQWLLFFKGLRYILGLLFYHNQLFCGMLFLQYINW